MNQLTKEQALQNLIVAASQGKYTLEEAEIIKQSIIVLQDAIIETKEEKQ